VRVLPYLIYLLLLAGHVVIFRELTSIWGATINLAAFMVLAVSLYKSELIAAWFGLAVGILLAAQSPQLMGWHAVSLAALGVLGYHVKDQLNLDSLYTRLLFILGGVFLHSIAEIIITGGGQILYRLGTNALPSAVYTVVVAIVFFLFKDGVITYRKFKSIF